MRAGFALVSCQVQVAVQQIKSALIWINRSKTRLIYHRVVFNQF